MAASSLDIIITLYERTLGGCRFTDKKHLSNKYLRPAVCTTFLGTLVFLLSPSHKWTATEPMNKNHVSLDSGAKGEREVTKATVTQNDVRGFSQLWSIPLPILRIFPAQTTTTTSLFLILNIQVSHHLQIAKLIKAGGVWTCKKT